MSKTDKLRDRYKRAVRLLTDLDIKRHKRYLVLDNAVRDQINNEFGGDFDKATGQFLAARKDVENERIRLAILKSTMKDKKSSVELKDLVDEYFILPSARFLK